MENATDDLRLVLSEWAEKVITEIREQMEAQNINASGETSKSLEYSIDDDGFGVKILGAEHFAERTETGRTPTVHKQDFDFVSIIKKWIADKGLQSHFGIRDDKDFNRIASAIVHNITTFGSAKYRGDMPKTDVYSSVVEKNVEEIGDKVLVAVHRKLKGIIEEL